MLSWIGVGKRPLRRLITVPGVINQKIVMNGCKFVGGS